MTAPYIRAQWRKHRTCPRWYDLATFAADIGDRPASHVLAVDGDVATCGVCPWCRMRGTARNAFWVAGTRAVGAPVVLNGVVMTKAEAARRLDISRQALHQRQKREGDPLRPRET